jgi:hypothetical protein
MEIGEKKSMNSSNRCCRRRRGKRKKQTAIYIIYASYYITCTCRQILSDNYYFMIKKSHKSTVEILS